MRACGSRNIAPFRGRRRGPPADLPRRTRPGPAAGIARGRAAGFTLAVMRAFLLALGLAALLPAAPARAQDPAPPAPATVRGYVWDSLLTNTLLPEARVVVNGPTRRAITADARGRFVLDSLRPGRYTFDFSHPSLDELAYTPPTQTVDLRPGEVRAVFLHTTAGAAIHAAICPGPREAQTGAVLGQLTDVRTERPIPDAEVRVEWSETVVSPTLGLSRQVRAARSPTDSAGRYRICGVPNDTPVLLRARMVGIDGPPLELDLGERPLAIRMLSLDTGAPAVAEGDSVRGTAVLRGTVRGNDGTAIPEAQVLVLGTPAGARTSAAGAFELGGLPAGTHSIEVRAIGFSRRRQMVTLHPDRPVQVEVSLPRMALVLPEVTVTERAPAASEFDQRRRSAGGAGHFMTREDIERRNPLRTEDLFRGVPGFSVVPSGGFDYSVVSTRGTGAAGRCIPDFYLDGVKLVVDPQIGGGLPVNPAEIHGIESYAGAAMVPAQYQSQTSCGVILIWTRQGVSRRR
jgi:hypothetical protein